MYCKQINSPAIPVREFTSIALVVSCGLSIDATMLAAAIRYSVNTGPLAICPSYVGVMWVSAFYVM